MEKRKMKLGVLIILQDEKTDINERIKSVKDMGFDSCQITCWNNSCYTDEMAEKINSACKEYGVNVSTFWAGWSGPGAWNFYEGQLTLGLVPAEYRDVRRRELIEASHFVKKLGVENIATHMGFIPENPNTGSINLLYVQ